MYVFLGSMHQNGSLATWEESWYVRPKLYLLFPVLHLIFNFWGFTMILHRNGRPRLLFDTPSAVELSVCNVVG